jgi:hypothetical protein
MTRRIPTTFCTRFTGSTTSVKRMVAMDSANGSQNLAPSWYAMCRWDLDKPAKHAREEGFALKGRRIPAQGNALG